MELKEAQRILKTMTAQFRALEKLSEVFDLAVAFQGNIERLEKERDTVLQEISKHNVLKALDLLENLTILFPDRTSTPDGTLSLLKELNAAAQSTHSASAIAVRPGQEETATGSEQECNETGTIG